MLEKTNLAEQEFDKAVNSVINELRVEIVNLRRQIEELKSDLRYYESQSTKNL